MAFQMNLWQASGNTLVEIDKAKLDSEDRLENWIANDPSLLGLGIEPLVIGKQVATDYGGRIDLLAINRDGDLLILELKRDRTPRDVIAQILDYASWVRDLGNEEIRDIASEFLKENLPEAFNKHFGELLPENINTAHRMIIVASEFDESSDRIVQYLADEYKVNINVVFFTFFRQGGNESVGRAWLRDPEQVHEPPKRIPWPGYWFVNVGEGPHRNWDDNTRYGYLSGGQGALYARALKRLKVGDKVFAYMAGKGYVGYGEVTHEAVMVKDFLVGKESKPLLELPLKAPNASENSEDPDLSDWAVGVKWLKIYPREDAIAFRGAFANPNVVCKLRQPETVEFLERNFEIDR